MSAAPPLEQGSHVASEEDIGSRMHCRVFQTQMVDV